MFISKEMAHAMASGRRQFLSVYEGRSVLFMPFGGDRCRYVGTHFVPELERSVMCEGEGVCRWCHLKIVAKCHVPALVFRRAEPYSTREGKNLPPFIEYVPELWPMKIVEITEACMKVWEEALPEGTLCTLARAPGRKNGKVEFRWMDSQLRNYPDTRLNVEELLPAVIRGTFYNGAKIALDKSGETPIKHKI